MRLKHLNLLMILILMTGLSALPVLAQVESRPNVVAQIYSADGTGYLTVIGPDGTNAGKLVENPKSRVDLSSDSRWLVRSGYDPDTQREVLNYAPIGGASVEVAIEPGFNVMDAHISRDNRLMFYTLVSLEKRQWILGLIAFDSGQVSEYLAPSDESSPVGANQVASVVDYDGANVLLYAFAPYTDGNFGGLYRLPVGPESLGVGRVPMPAASGVFTVRGQALVQPSPDGRKVAIMYGDAANPPTNYEAMGPGATFNTLAVLDLATSELKVVAQAGIGEALETMTWTPDSTSIIFTGGTYQNTFYLVTPNFFRVDAVSGQVSVLGLAVTERTELVGSMRACGEYLFFDVVSEQGQGDARLFSSPLNNLAERTMLLTAKTFVLGGCASAG
ncbi:MAG: hypothetical protein IAE83_06950 [Anaerolinea sp.]|nr:hypothetical protein [Anaerolinea sp.]MCC6976378.1 hypothetical protein [Anaerolineae bacterium]